MCKFISAGQFWTFPCSQLGSFTAQKNCIVFTSQNFVSLWRLNSCIYMEAVSRKLIIAIRDWFQAKRVKSRSTQNKRRDSLVWFDGAWCVKAHFVVINSCLTSDDQRSSPSNDDSTPWLEFYYRLGKKPYCYFISSDIVLVIRTRNQVVNSR